jgi:hypothetical protein
MHLPFQLYISIDVKRALDYCNEYNDECLQLLLSASADKPDATTDGQGNEHIKPINTDT